MTDPNPRIDKLESEVAILRSEMKEQYKELLSKLDKIIENQQANHVLLAVETQKLNDTRIKLDGHDLRIGGTEKEITQARLTIAERIGPSALVSGLISGLHVAVEWITKQ